jgi:WS/DGAT/MGAT family acyltransferase
MGEAERFARHMSDEDALMWSIEKDPVLRSTIVALAIFDRPPEWHALRRRLARATHSIPRLRQRVASPPLRLGPPRWVDEPSFDLDYHLRRVRVPAPGDLETLLAAVQPIAAASFDRARPLWEFTLLEGLRPDVLPDPGTVGGTERAALVMKVHHAVTDGVGGMALLAQLVDLEPGSRRAEEGDGEHEDTPPVTPPEPLSAVALVRDSLVHTERRLLGIARRTPATVAAASFAATRDPLAAAGQVAHTMRSVARALAPATAPMSPLLRGRGIGRRLALFDVSLDDLRRVGKITEGSVNDVFVAAVLGGLRVYHAQQGSDVEYLRMTLPINLRTRADEPAGNKFAPARFPVPAHVVDPAERIRAVRALVQEWRAEPALALTGTLAGILNRLPTATTTALFGGMLKSCDFVATNVPGAPVPVYAAGARVDRLYAFAPPTGAALNVSLISHCDTCCIGVVVDTTAVADPDALVQSLREGFDEVLALADPLP